IALDVVDILAPRLGAFERDETPTSALDELHHESSLSLHTVYADKYQPGVLVLGIEVLQKRHCFHTWSAARIPEIQEHNFSFEVVERHLLPVGVGLERKRDGWFRVRRTQVPHFVINILVALAQLIPILVEGGLHLWRRRFGKDLQQA